PIPDTRSTPSNVRNRHAAYTKQAHPPIPGYEKSGRTSRGCPPAFAVNQAPERGVRSLERDLAAGLLELGLGGLGGLLVDLLEQRLRGALDELLGLLQAEARDDLAHDLDDLDLLVAGVLEDDVELVLLLGGGSALAATRGGGHDLGGRGGGGDVEGLLELGHELGQLKQRQLLEGVEQFVGAHLRHGGVPSLRSTLGSGVDVAVSSRRRSRIRTSACPRARRRHGPSSTAAPRTARRPATAWP